MTSSSIHFHNNGEWNALPAELLCHLIHCLSIGERLRTQRVSPRWSRVIWELGWSDLRKINREVVFEGATLHQIERFNGKHLISILNQVVLNLLELDIALFEVYMMRQQFVSQIAEYLKKCKKLEKLNITGSQLSNFVNFLPQNLRQLQSTGGITIQCVERLAQRCPNLEEVPFNSVMDMSMDTVNKYIGKFLRLKTLQLSIRGYTVKNGLIELWRLKELEVVELYHFGWGFDERAAKATAANCRNLRKLSVQTLFPLGEASLQHLAELYSLTVLEIHFAYKFSDATLRLIAVRGQLKKLKLLKSIDLTDDAVVFLVERCKSLVSLDLSGCPQVTERTLNAVILEVHQRHGLPLRALPIGPLDSGIFFFRGLNTTISVFRLKEVMNDNPWLNTWDEDPREII